MSDIKGILHRAHDALRAALLLPGIILFIAGAVCIGVVILSFVVIAMLYHRAVQRTSWREAWDLAWRTTTTKAGATKL